MDPACLSSTMLHWSIVEHAQARRIAAAHSGRCFAPCTGQQERLSVLEFTHRLQKHGVSHTGYKNAEAFLNKLSLKERAEMKQRDL